jgi:hypothetical protein
LKNQSKWIQIFFNNSSFIIHFFIKGMKQNKKRFVGLFISFLLIGITNVVGQGFITTWQTTTANESITIPTTGTGYNYAVDWGDTDSDVSQTGDATHIYTAAGTYTVTITGTFPRIYFNNGGDRTKIKSIDQWGSSAWTSM